MRPNTTNGLCILKHGTFGATCAVALLAGALLASYSGNAQASSAFARQTGMSCFACHTRPPSMTAIGKRFFLQGYRTPSIRRTIEHGKPGTDGGRLNITFDEMQWWRVRSTPLIKEQGRPTVDPDNQNEWFAMPVQRFSWGVAGPIGDHWSVWNEIYYQPYDEEDDQFRPGGSGPGANSRGDWRQSTVEVDELEFVYGRELPQLLPGNYFGAYISDRGYRKVQNRGGTGLHNTVSGAEADNGGVGVFGFWNDKYYANLHLLTGESVNWEKLDLQFNLGWWPRNSQQDDLYIDFLYTNAQDSGAELGETLLGTAADNEKDEGNAFDLRAQYVKADWGPHTIDAEWGIGWMREKYNVGLPTANTFEGTETSGGVRYWYNRRWGGEVLYSRWLKYENESDITGEKVEYNSRGEWSYGLLYQFAANILLSAEYRQNVGGPFFLGIEEPPVRYEVYELKLEFGF